MLVRNRKILACVTLLIGVSLQACRGSRDDAVRTAPPQKSASDSRANATNDLPSSPKVVTDGGWEVPGLRDSEVSRADEEPGQPPPGSQIELTVLKPRRELISQVNRYALSKSGALHLFPEEWVVDRINRYAVDGKVYCHVVFASRVRTVGKSIERYGADTQLFYCDEDGNGTLETFEHGVGRADRSLVPPPPGWVLESE